MQKGFSKILIIIILLAVLAGGFLVYQYRLKEKITEIPNDLQIEYGWGACHMDWGWNTLEIDSEGNAKLTQSFKKEKQYAFSEGELVEIYREIMKNKFFELKEKYYNPNIIDGGCSAVRIRADGEEHKVLTSNEDVKQIDKITQKILEILSSKDNSLEY